MIYDSSGAINVNVVDGTSYTGLYAADGAMNVVSVDGDTYTGKYHSCGAMNVFVDTENTDTENPPVWSELLTVEHPCGALRVIEEEGPGLSATNAQRVVGIAV